MRIFLLICILCYSCAAHAGLLISEVACGTEGDDWVEIVYQSNDRSSIDVSHLFVTMYYGTNESLSGFQVTLYSYNRPETPYDDRYAVVHLCRPGIPDETDLTGDADGDGHLDLYCNNYSGSLWNAECVVAIDTDDDPSNGSIDFVAWSDNDGSPSDTILSYTEHAVRTAGWISSSAVGQSCMVKVPHDGLKSYESIIRIGGVDTNSNSDFTFTSCQTPGHDNILSIPGNSSSIFNLEKKKILIIPGDPAHPGECPITVNEKCSLRMRIFSDIGQLVYDSGSLKEVAPGKTSIPWAGSRSARTGLYIAQIEGSVSSNRKSSTKKCFFIVTRYR